MRNYSLYFAVFLTLAITWGSLLPTDGNQENFLLISDKLIHVFSYFLLTIAWLRTYNLNKRILRSSVLIALTIGLYGIIIEVLQGSITISREFDIHDIYANVIGICIAVVLFSIVFRKKPVN